MLSKFIRVFDSFKTKFLHNLNKFSVGGTNKYMAGNINETFSCGQIALPSFIFPIKMKFIKLTIVSVLGGSVRIIKRDGRGILSIVLRNIKKKNLNYQVDHVKKLWKHLQTSNYRKYQRLVQNLILINFYLIFSFFSIRYFVKFFLALKPEGLKKHFITLRADSHHWISLNVPAKKQTFRWRDQQQITLQVFKLFSWLSFTPSKNQIW